MRLASSPFTCGSPLMAAPRLRHPARCLGGLGGLAAWAGLLAGTGGRWLAGRPGCAVRPSGRGDARPGRAARRWAPRWWVRGVSADHKLWSGGVRTATPVDWRAEWAQGLGPEQRWLDTARRAYCRRPGPVGAGRRGVRVLPGVGSAGQDGLDAPGEPGCDVDGDGVADLQAEVVLLPGEGVVVGEALGPGLLAVGERPVLALVDA